MNSVLDGKCLKVNSQWVAIDVITPRKAIEDACAPTQARFIKMIDGHLSVLTMDEWMGLVPKDGEDFIQLSHGKRICVPRVSICSEYNKVRAKGVPFNLLNLAKRYDYTCAVTKKRLAPEQFSREHVTPKSKGGQSGWDHEVLMDRRLNNKRGNRDYESLGLQEPEILGAPPPVLPVHVIHNIYRYPEWDYFLPKHGVDLP
jgi:hypothetical protein